MPIATIAPRSFTKPVPASETRSRAQDMGVGLTRVAEIMATKKVADATMPIAGGAVTAASGLANVARFAGMGAGAAGATAAAGGAGAGAAAGGAAAAASAPAWAYLVATIQSLAPYLVLAGAGILAFKENVFGVGDWLTQRFANFGATVARLGTNWDDFVAAMMRLGTALAPVAAVIGSAMVLAFGALVAVADVVVSVVSGLVDVLGLLAGAAASAVAGISSAIAGLTPKLGASPLEGPEVYAPADYSGLGPQFATTNGGAVRNGLNAPPAPKGGGGGAQKVEVTIKWDLGDGNEDAIYIKSREQIGKALKQARQIAKSSTIGGAR